MTSFPNKTPAVNKNNCWTREKKDVIAIRATALFNIYIQPHLRYGGHPFLLILFDKVNVL